MKLGIQTCSHCGREVRGPAFYRHLDACRAKHGQGTGKIWRATFRRVAKKSAGLLRAMAKSPSEHQEDLFGPRKSPQDVLDALERAKTRRELTWGMSWAWGWRRLLEKDLALWPQDRLEAIWDRIWRRYSSLFGKLRGKARLIDRDRFGRQG